MKYSIPLAFADKASLTHSSWQQEIPWTTTAWKFRLVQPTSSESIRRTQNYQAWIKGYWFNYLWCDHLSKHWNYVRLQI
jgi:hypothetical protein